MREQLEIQEEGFDVNPVTKWKLPFGVLQTLLFYRKGVVVGVF